MARPREFDLERALEAATDVFWAHGYRGTSMAALLDSTGLSRGSVYKAFKDKRSIYLLALEHYDRGAVSGAVELLMDPAEPDGAKRIACLFDTAVATVREDGDRRGCLLCNAAAGPAAEDPEIGRAVSAMLGRMTRAFAFALKASPALARVTDAEIDRRAQGLTASYVGLRILARAGQPVGELEQIAKGALVHAAHDPGNAGIGGSE